MNELEISTTLFEILAKLNLYDFSAFFSQVSLLPQLLIKSRLPTNVKVSSVTLIEYLQVRQTTLDGKLQLQNFKP